MSALHRNERGSVTLWMLGLGLMLLTLGGLSLDLWRLVGERRELATMADAAAVAGANGVDIDVFRESGLVQLDPLLVSELAATSLGVQPTGGDVILEADWLSIEPDQVSVVVTLRRQVDLTLLRIAGGTSIEIGASGRATAQVGG